ncbi:Uncharacterised protein [Klebsiella pneumoniae]|nr:Uncharacterised protein [Klebsiella pneumoniae]
MKMRMPTILAISSFQTANFVFDPKVFEYFFHLGCFQKNFICLSLAF